MIKELSNTGRKTLLNSFTSSHQNRNSRVIQGNWYCFHRYSSLKTSTLPPFVNFRRSFFTVPRCKMPRKTNIPTVILRGLEVIMINVGLISNKGEISLTTPPSTLVTRNHQWKSAFCYLILKENYKFWVFSLILTVSNFFFWQSCQRCLWLIQFHINDNN